MPAKPNSQSPLTFSVRCQDVIPEIAEEKLNGPKPFQIEKFEFANKDLAINLLMT